MRAGIYAAPLLPGDCRVQAAWHDGQSWAGPGRARPVDKEDLVPPPGCRHQVGPPPGRARGSPTPLPPPLLHSRCEHTPLGPPPLRLGTTGRKSPSWGSGQKMEGSWARGDPLYMLGLPSSHSSGETPICRSVRATFKRKQVQAQMLSPGCDTQCC